MQLRELTANVKLDVRKAIKGMMALEKAFKDTRDSAVKLGKDEAKAAKESAASNKAANREKVAADSTAARKRKMIAIALAKAQAKAEKDSVDAARAAARQRKAIAKALARAQARATRSRSDDAIKRKAQIQQSIADFKSFALASTAAGVVAVAAVTSIVTSWANAGNEISLLSRRFLIPQKELAELGAIGKMAGVDIEDVADAIKEMNIRIAEAQLLGSGTAVDALNLLGLSASQFVGIGVHEKIDLVADALQRVDATADRSFIIEEIFGGDAGIKFAALLEGGAAGFRGRIKSAIGSGAVLSSESIDQARELTKAFKELVAQFMAVRNIVASRLAPAIKDIIRRWQEYLKTNREILSQRLADMFQSLVRLLEKLAPLMLELADGSLKAVDAVGGVESALKLAFAAMLAFKILSLSVFGPTGVLIAGAVAAGAAISVLNAKSAASTIKKQSQEDDALKDFAFRSDSRFTNDEEMFAIPAGRAALIAEGRARVLQDKLRSFERNTTQRQSMLDELRSARASGLPSFGETTKLLLERTLSKKLIAEIGELRKEAALNIAALSSPDPMAPIRAPAEKADPKSLADFRRLKALKESNREAFDADPANAVILRSLAVTTGRADPFAIEDAAAAKVKDPKAKKHRKPESKKKERTIAELVGLGAEGIDALSTIQPKGLGTVVNHFTFNFNVRAPVEVKLVDGAGIDSKVAADRIVATAGSSIANSVREAMRGSVGQLAM